MQGSKTIIASAIAFVAALLQALGIEWNLADQAGMVNTVVIMISTLSAVYFRFVAKKDLQTGGPLIKESTKV